MSKIMNKICLMEISAVSKGKALLKNERGETNIIAIILILAIVISLAIIFRNNLKTLFNRIWSFLFDQVGEVLV